MEQINISKKVVIGGTFDILHRGHEALLLKAFELGEVTIGLTSDVMVKKIKEREIKEFEQRKKELENFITENLKTKAEIIKIEDKFGTTLKEDFDYIVVSPGTYPTALLINRERKKRKKKPIRIVKIKFILGKDKKPLSVTKMLRNR